MMKAAVPMAAILVIAIIGVAAVMYVTGVGLVGRAELVTIGGDTCQLIRPIFGRYECAPMTQVANQWLGSATGNQMQSSTYLFCNANTPSCDVSVQCNYASSGWVVGSTYIWYQEDGNSACPVGDQTKWCTAPSSQNAPTKLATLQKGERVRYGVCTADSDILRKGAPATFYTTYTPYGLYKYHSGAAKQLVNAQLCTIFDTSIIKDCSTFENTATGNPDSRSFVCTDDSGSTSLGRTLKADGQLVFGDWVNFLDFYLDVPHISNIKDYNGQQVVCEAYSNRVQLYSLGKFTTQDKCYFAEKEVIATVDCCEGERYQNYICQNWKWVQVTQDTQPSCFSKLECTNRGDVYVRNGVKYKETCSSGSCVEQNLGTAECISSSQCQSGYVCNLQSYVCERSIPNVICGDGICSSPYESVQTCPADCTQKNAFDFVFDWLAAFVIGLLVSGVLLVILVVVPIPPLMPAKLWLFRNKMALLGLWLAMALILSLLLFGVLAPIGASLIGGML